MSSEEFHLPDRVTVEHAQEALAAATGLAEGGAMSIDASKVENIDGGSVLALANIARTLAARETKLAVLAPTPAFMDAFSDLGLFEDLMKMEFRK